MEILKMIARVLECLILFSPLLLILFNSMKKENQVPDLTAGWMPIVHKLKDPDYEKMGIQK